jgi:hypothetical protein
LISVTLHKFYSTGSNIGGSNQKLTPEKAFVGLSAFSSNGLSLVISNSSDSLY